MTQQLRLQKYANKVGTNQAYLYGITIFIVFFLQTMDVPHKLSGVKKNIIQPLTSYVYCQTQTYGQN